MVESNPFAPPSAELGADATPGSGPLADRGTRLGAAILDGLLYVPLLIPFFVVTLMNEASSTVFDPNSTEVPTEKMLLRKSVNACPRPTIAFQK